MSTADDALFPAIRAEALRLGPGNPTARLLLAAGTRLADALTEREELAIRLLNCAAHQREIVARRAQDYDQAFRGNGLISTEAAWLALLAAEECLAAADAALKDAGNGQEEGKEPQVPTR